MQTSSEPIVGIDLGTTNSEIAAFVDGKPQVIGNGAAQMMLPSPAWGFPHRANC